MKTKLIEKAKQISTEYKFGDFFRNFLAVILGIIITFAGSDWITEHNAQKEVKESILLVKSELQTNREDIAYIKELVELEQKGALYLLEYKGRIQEADPDSLQKYIIRKSKFPQNPKRSVRFSGKGTKRSVQKRKARNTQKAETKVL